ncbi:MAG TPA: hypothetical protein VIF09_24815 [Polyangiaceae bacterium]
MSKGAVLVLGGVAAASAAAAVACSIQTIFPGGLDPPPGTASQQVGAAGGTVSANDGTSIYVPPNALKSQVVITIGLAPDAGAPDGATSVGAAHVFGPPGLVFYGPVCVTMAFEPPILPQGTTEANVVVYEQVPPSAGDTGDAADGGSGEGGEEGGAVEGGASGEGGTAFALDPCLPCPVSSADGGTDGSLPAGADSSTDAGAVAPDGGPLPTDYPVGTYFAVPSFAADPSHVTGMTRQLGTMSLAFSPGGQEIPLVAGDAGCAASSPGGESSE